MIFELKNLFTGLTQNPGFEKIDVIMKNEAFSVLFSKMMNDKVGTEAKMDIYFIKNVSSLPGPCFSSTRKQLGTTFAGRS